MVQPLPPETITEILETQRFGRLACIFADQPYIIPVTYVMADGFIYGQTNEGTKLEIIRLNTHVCFEVDRQYADSWQSVVIVGDFEELHGADAAIAREHFIEKAFPIIEAYRSEGERLKDLSYPENVRRMKQVIYRIRINSRSGYQEVQ